MLRYAVLAALVAACTAEVDDNDNPNEGQGDDGFGELSGKADGATNSWTSIGYGVAYQRVNTGNAIVIAYGGYSAQLSYSAAWATELVDAKLGADGIGQIYAVKGPQDPGYDAKEIGNSKLRAHLLTIDDGTSPILIVAHSSGSYVAHELLGQLRRHGDTDILARIGYADLDGGGSGLDGDLVDSLHAMTFTYAKDPTLSTGMSENSSTAIALGMAYAPHATTFQVTVPSTGCANGYGWCLHDVLVTHRPHDRYHYDLADDYTDFVNRAPTIEYLDTLE